MISMLMHASIKLQLIVYEYIYYIQVLLISNLKSAFFSNSFNKLPPEFVCSKPYQTLWIMGSVSVSGAKV